MTRVAESFLCPIWWSRRRPIGRCKRELEKVMPIILHIKDRIECRANSKFAGD